VEVKATDVKKLRDKTGAGMMDCKKALQEAGGDFAKAEKILKELGLAAAAKRAGRATNAGRIFTRLTPNKAICLELTCETDFVAKNSDFIALGNRLTDYLAEHAITQTDKQMEELVASTIGIIKENITIRRFKTLTAGESEIFIDYVHGEGNIGVIIKLDCQKKELKDNPEVRELGFNLALHTAAFAPLYLAEENVDEGYLKEQYDIFMKQAQQLDKPANVLDGIVKGKLKKHFAEICLLEQGYVKDEKLPVKKVIEALSQKLGVKLALTDYIYFRVGEEI